MSGFEVFIYHLGAWTFAAGCTGAVAWILYRIERPRRRRQ